ncbi:MAG: hypothetical protein RJA19_589 [Bacteroidota bacterium]|jgi:hypothetical protein
MYSGLWGEEARSMNIPAMAFPQAMHHRLIPIRRFTESWGMVRIPVCIGCNLRPGLRCLPD